MSQAKSADPFDPANLVLGEDYLLARGASAKNQRPAKSPIAKASLKFYKFPAQLDRDLVAVKANWTVWAMVRALYETWFTLRTYPNHPNPFPLAACDTKKWGLSRWQRSRALRVLTKTGWILLDQRNPKKPLVALAWQPFHKS
jgi:hypothetical protein